MANYNLTLEDAMHTHPLAATLILMPCYAERQGATDIFGYTDKAAALARKTTKGRLVATYKIVDDPLEKVGWQLGAPPAFLAPILPP